MEALPVGLLEMANRADHAFARKHSASVGEHRRKRAHAGTARGVGCRRRQCFEVTQMPLNLGFDPAFEPCPQRRALVGRQAVERARGAHRRLKQRTARRETAEEVALPGDGNCAAVFGDERERLVAGVDQVCGAAVELVAQAALGGGQQQPLVGEPRGRIDLEVEAGQMADRFGPDADFAVGGDGHRKGVGAARADVAHQHRGAAVDEALGQALVERVAERAPRPRACAPPIWPVP